MESPPEVGKFRVTERVFSTVLFQAELSSVFAPGSFQRYVMSPQLEGLGEEVSEPFSGRHDCTCPISEPRA